MRRDGGFVLINALILVAALAAVSVYLLTRAETGRVRLSDQRDADQVMLILDSFEAYAQSRVIEALSGGGTAQEGQADGALSVPVARGRVSGTLRELDGLFNLNWLANPTDELADVAFRRLLDRLALPPDTADLLVARLAGGAAAQEAIPLSDPPVHPVGGPVPMMALLRDLPGLSPRTRDALVPFVTVIPGDSRLNVNAAPLDVLAAFLPEATPGQIAQLVSSRAVEPFGDVNDFLLRTGLAEAPAMPLPPDSPPVPDAAGPPRLDEARIALQSRWFEAFATAELADLQATRLIQLEYRGPGERPAINWRITTRP
ncbi:general secretion pathway protein GspK [Maritimibacter alkaliphilus]|uniref:general secretion pathway protein GspK n=1 Tax=Maritimibacter alkaliphilus TaxID=404236 RepID=UPI001C94DD93|nr:type II secretion system protein GspK [Maritimibacter alkaliphilus]MBY6092508.1 general secretion pathway protein GspK [Maritimibacter alkaliphilus]